MPDREEQTISKAELSTFLEGELSAFKQTIREEIRGEIQELQSPEPLPKGGNKMDP